MFGIFFLISSGLENPLDGLIALVLKVLNPKWDVLPLLFRIGGKRHETKPLIYGFSISYNYSYGELTSHKNNCSAILLTSKLVGVHFVPKKVI